MKENWILLGVLCFQFLHTLVVLQRSPQNLFLKNAAPDMEVSGKSLDGAGSVVDIIDKSLSIADKANSFGLCCISDDGGYCPDSSKSDTSKNVGFLGIGRGHCSTKSCNAYGCNCDGVCKSPDGGITVGLCTSSSESINGKCESNSIYRENFRVKPNQCLNLDSSFDDRARTVIPIGGACVRIWEHSNCKGEGRDISRERKLNSVYMLDGRTFYDKVSSLSQCQNSEKTTYSSRGYYCESPCAKYNEDYYWCDARGSIGNMANDVWDYCSISPDTDATGKKCTDNCEHRQSTRYKWCHTKGGNWGYCSQDAAYHNHRHYTRYGQQCDSPCSKNGKNYYWCFGHSNESTITESTGQSSWDYCSPDSGKTIYVNQCRENHKCGRHGKPYCWCYTDSKDNWEYCSCLDESKNNDRTRYGVKCTTACQKQSSSDYSLCYYDNDGNWDYCSLVPNHTIKGTKCRDNHQCDRNGKKYCWCYTDSLDNWDYCSCPVKNSQELTISTRRGVECLSKCETQGKDYYWCYENRGPNYPQSSVSDWDYCSPAPGLTIYGTKCRSGHECSKRGKGYCWCYTDSQDNWSYCSSNTCS